MPEPALAEQAAERRFLTFRVRGRRYALPAEDVSEVIVVPPVARLPHGPKSLMGLANLRGTVIPVVDPAVLLNLGAFSPGGAARAIVLDGVALAVEAVETLVRLDASGVETSQADLAAESGEVLLGAFRIGGEAEVTKILDLTTMLGAAFGERAKREPRAGQTAVKELVPATAATVEQRLLISFDVAGQDYALPLDSVREIIPLPSTISVVPRAETVLLGVTAWRDALLPLLSLRALLGFPLSEAATGREKVLVIQVKGATVGLVADRARALIRADAASIDPAPAMLAARSGGESKIIAIFRGDGGKRLISLLAPEQLFREDVMRRLGESVSVPSAGSGGPVDGAASRYVVFRLGDEEFGLPIGAVDEVARVPEQMTRVPKMPKFLAGVINLRGEVLPVVDQRRRFNMPEYDGRAGQRLIVVRSERHRAGLIVDAVSEVLRAPAGSVEPPPDLTGQGDRLISGVINAPATGRMILLLDPSELLTRAEHGALDELELE